MRIMEEENIRRKLENKKQAESERRALKDQGNTLEAGGASIPTEGSDEDKPRIVEEDSLMDDDPWLKRKMEEKATDGTTGGTTGETTGGTTGETTGETTDGTTGGTTGETQLDDSVDLN